MKNLIDTQSGQIRINENLFYYKMNFEDAISLSKGFKYETLDHNNGYKWINLKEIELSESFFFFGLCFKNDLLHYINFAFYSLDELKKTWEDWSEENELNKKELYDKWLTSNLSEKRKFEWGNIKTYYDPKGGTSGILIKYK